MICFLDIDGVLNSREHFYFRGTAEGQKRKNKILTENEGLTAIELIQLDENKVKLLRQFTIDTGCKHVISSTWRERSTPQHFEELFKLSGHEFPNGSVIGCTPILDHIEHQKRGHEIKQWLSDNRYFGRYVVLDDDSPTIFLEEQPLVNTNFKTGVTEENLEKAKEILLSPY